MGKTGHTNLHRNIRSLRKANGASQLELALAIGVSGSSTISNYEAGRNNPDLDLCLRIAAHYGVTLDALVYGEFEGALPEESEKGERK